MNTIVGVNVFEQAPALGAAVQPAPTSVIAVLGVFDRGRPHHPVRIAGPEKIEAAFGPVRTDAVSALAMVHCFGNGGREIVAARVVAAAATPASVMLDDAQAAPALRLRAGDRGVEDPGLWGRRLSVIVSDDPAFTGALAADAAATDTSVTLASVAGLGVGQTLRFIDDPGGGPVTQYRQIVSIDPATGTVTFTDGLSEPLTTAGTTVISTEFRLRLFHRSSEAAQPAMVEDWRGLSMTRTLAGYAPPRINDPLSGSRYAIADDRRPATTTAATQEALPAIAETGFSGGSEPAPSASDYIGDAASRSGLHAFDREAVQLLTLPDVHSLSAPGRQSAVTAAIGYCENRNDCMFLGSLPDRGGASPRPQSPADYTQSEADFVAAVESYVTAFHQPKSFAGFYGPFGAVEDPRATGPASRRMIPLCLPVAGVFADVALRRSIFKAPAGAGAQLRGITELSAHLTDAQNTRVVRTALANMARRDDVLGLHIASSRTASTDARWYFVNVRLLFNFVVASLRTGLRGFVHEMHDERLRRRAISSVSGFLDGLRQRGAFATDDAERAYRVKSDSDNNTAASIARGELNIDVEINPARPAEQINLRVGVTPLGVSLTEN
ncbi:phage tail sheath C-terminal domain-containing protein [Roseibium marinum]|uniref:Tail sheath protein n=1 Tax=Roseibium marinum TaxID=281252 RepID=A0A2S3UN30_9HYPH|nr:phage tail sheath C-terminal domain-containing protein [Roseibium marinum]POF29094.1 tail sheath protein [Roseibium marinum]